MLDIKSDLNMRIGRVQKQMAERGFGGLIVFYGGQHNMLRMDPILLLADFRVLGPAALLVPRNGSPRLIITPAWDGARAQTAVCVGPVDAVEESALATAIAAAASLLDAPLAMVGQDVMPLGFARELRTALGAEPLDGGEVVRATATTRTPVELARIERAAAMAERKAKLAGKRLSPN